MASNTQKEKIGDNTSAGSGRPVDPNAEGGDHNEEARDQNHAEKGVGQDGDTSKKADQGKYYNEDNLQIWKDRCLRRNEEVKEMANKLADLQSVVNFMMQNNVMQPPYPLQDTPMPAANAQKKGQKEILEAPQHTRSGRHSHRPSREVSREEKTYNKKVNPRDFQVNDLVLRKVVSNKKDPREGKLGPNWEGPYRITSVKTGTSLKRKKKKINKIVMAFKLSKRKPDDNLQILHTILFGKKTKAHSLKINIGQFSGYVWVENEEKQRARVKEKIDRCVKEKLLDFCDVLNIPINRGNVKKQELSTKLLEFWESPHPTTDTFLADKEQSLGVEAYTSWQGLNLKLCYNKARRRRVQVVLVPL
ncbi:Protein DEK [Camellia lanceoleosa]|uniref:Protein DEK n=1 Tax=Camellia lanceoleosa TaxID=1840588 RepID=A0ACC0GE42_9ERIC|nr:Protein DEK [Camellia lanceoleosa]